jgi:hypothetical protein
MSKLQYKLLTYDKDEDLQESYLEEMKKENFSPLLHKMIVDTKLKIEEATERVHIVYNNIFIGNEFSGEELPVSFDWAAFSPDGEQHLFEEGVDRDAAESISGKILQDVIIHALKDSMKQVEKEVVTKEG